MTVTINGTTGITSPEVVLDNAAADGGQVVLKSSGYSNWNWDNYSGRLRAYYNATEYFTIDTSGNVGVGTSSPVTLKSSTTLQVLGNIKVGNANGAGLISLGDTASTGANAGIWRGAAGAYGSTGNYLNLGGYDGIAFTTGNAEIASQTERARIDSSGNWLVNSTSAGLSGAGFQVIKYANGNYADIGHTTGDAGSEGYVRFVRGGTVVGQIQSNGTTQVSYSTSSDYRLKENIQPMTGALATVAQLKPVTYTWKADGSAGQGFIAHELQEVVPDCVTGKKDAVDADGNPVYQGIDTSFLVATLTAAIQEQQAIITTLTARIEALEAKNA